MSRDTRTPPGPPTADPADDELPDIDPEVALITDYLANELPRSQRVALERRLDDDAEFRDRMLPYITIWNARASEVNDGDARDEGDDRASAHARDAGATDAHGGDAGRDARQQLRRLRRWQLAASLAIAACTVTVGWLVVDWYQRVTTPAAIMAEAPANDGRTVVIHEQAWVALNPGATLVYRTAIDENGVQPLRLEGSADFRFPLDVGAGYVVITPSARIQVAASDFRVDVTDPSTTVITARVGRLVVESRGPEGYSPLAIGPGEVVRVTWGQPPRSVQ
jgi:ferric-dicitrate binding protein FerR (iron transport regulator)